MHDVCYSSSSRSVGGASRQVLVRHLHKGQGQAHRTSTPLPTPLGRLGLPEQLRLPSAILHRQLQQAHLRLLTPSPVQHCCRQCEGAPLASAIQIDVRVDGTFVPSSTVVGWVGPSPLAFNGIVSSQTTEPPRNHSSSTARVEVKSILCWFPCSHDVTFPSRLPLNSFS